MLLIADGRVKFAYDYCVIIKEDCIKIGKLNLNNWKHLNNYNLTNPFPLCYLDDP